MPQEIASLPQLLLGIIASIAVQKLSPDSQPRPAEVGHLLEVEPKLR